MLPDRVLRLGLAGTRGVHVVLRAVLACAGGVAAFPFSGSGQVARWTLERTVTIGDALDPETGLTRVGSVIGHSGRLLVGQPREQRIRIFSQEGDLLGFIGRQGEGPGEFEWVSGMGLHRGFVWVNDRVLRRIQYFDGEYRVVSSRRMRGHPTLRSNPPLVRGILPDGSMIAALGRLVPQIVAFPDRPEPVIRFDPEGRLRDTVAVLTGRDNDVKIPRERGSVAFLSLPGSDRSLFEAAPDGSGFAVVHRETATSDERHTYRVIRFDSRADTAWAHTFPYDPIPVSRAWRSRNLEARARGENAHGRRVLERAYDALKFFPPIDDLHAGADGTTWLLVRTGVDSFEWEVLDDSGRVTARLAPPAAGRIKWSDADAAWFTETDELDVPYLVRYAIHRP